MSPRSWQSERFCTARSVLFCTVDDILCDEAISPRPTLGRSKLSNLHDASGQVCSVRTGLKRNVTGKDIACIGAGMFSSSHDNEYKDVF